MRIDVVEEVRWIRTVRARSVVFNVCEMADWLPKQHIPKVKMSLSGRF